MFFIHAYMHAFMGRERALTDPEKEEEEGSRTDCSMGYVSGSGFV